MGEVPPIAVMRLLDDPAAVRGGSDDVPHGRTHSTHVGSHG